MEELEGIQKIESLVSRIETIGDAKTQAIAVELVQAMMEYHGKGIERMLEIIAEKGEQGYAIIDDLGKDELVASLMFLYGQHPVPLEERVMKGLDDARPILQTHDGDVEVLSLNNGILNLRLKGTCDGCPSSADTLKNAIEEAVYKVAPDLNGIFVENLTETKTLENGFVHIEGLKKSEPLVCPTAAT
ncbi:MAG: NifU family protein [Aridibacter sp.]